MHAQLYVEEGLLIIAQQMRYNSERWFPQIHDGSVDLTTFYALGLAGEAGEVANIAKKLIRKHDDPADLRSKIATEISDVFTYLLLLADELGVNIMREYEDKVRVNNERWG